MAAIAAMRVAGPDPQAEPRRRPKGWVDGDLPQCVGHLIGS